ncbi:MAG: 2-C-methyl-D-erythritol 2,4-cyclodiphosphate synthase [Oscillospiraceae bacterium]|nr:2-C-methyl-D-erythritol 2,4-cyclodiphosphate synthase [Oscillospiraceae bacterium]
MKVAIGQDSHKFDFNNQDKKLILGGVLFEGDPPLLGNSDADVILHSITNAVSGITGINILGKIADDLCENGIENSRLYLEEALKYLDNDIVHLSISIECKIPKIAPKTAELRTSIANILKIEESQIGITATTGDELTEVGKGNGIQVFTAITVN